MTSTTPATTRAQGAARPDPPERVIVIRPRSVLAALGLLLLVAAGIGFLFLTQATLTLIAIALFVSLALNPAVNRFEHRGMPRGRAVAAVFALAVIAVALLGLVLIPPLIVQISRFIAAVPGLLGELSASHGSLGFLERNYHVVERVRSALSANGTETLTGAAGPAVSVLQGLATTVFGVVVIAFLTLFMLLEGREWRDRVVTLMPEGRQAAVARIGSGVYKSVGGFVTGNLLASFLAGIVATLLLLVTGVPYAIPLGLFVAIIELIPYIGPVATTILLTAVALTQGVVPALIVFVFLTIYHAVEGHTLRPLIYGRAVKLSPLAVLIAILLGTEMAGVLGALAAIPIAGSVQVLVAELMRERGVASADEERLLAQ